MIDHDIEIRAAFNAWIKAQDPKTYRAEWQAFQAGWQAALAAQPSGQAQQDAGSLREPKNGSGWRVEWWNESMRLMLPNGYRIESHQHYRNGTMQLTIKRVDAPPLRVSPGDRVAQALVLPVERAEFIEVEHLAATERGEGGFGSTGA